MRRAAIAALVLVACLIAALFLWMPTRDSAPQLGDGQVRVEQVDTAAYPQISLFVSVRDAAGEPRGDLSRDDFTVTEDGQPVEIADFRGGGAAGAISAALVIDRSGSMDDDDKIDGARDAAAAFVEQMRPGDQATIITFNESVLTYEDFTSDQQELLREVRQLRPEGNTAIFDAVIAGVEALRDQPGRRLLLLLTDGEDTSSDASLAEALEYAEQAGQPVYVVGLGGRGVNVFGFQLFAQIDEETLQKIADETGGRYFYAPDAADLAMLYTDVAGGVQQEYRLTYVSPRPFYDGTRRDIQVAVDGVTAGTGYTERHLINVVSSPLVGLVLLVPLAGLLALPEIMRRRRAGGKGSASAGAPPLAAPAPALAQAAPAGSASPAAAPATIAVAPASASATIPAAPAPATQRVCVSCAAPLRQGARFCSRCGVTQPVVPAPAAERRSFCDMCGSPLMAGSQFCTACGEPVARRESTR